MFAINIRPTTGGSVKVEVEAGMTVVALKEKLSGEAAMGHVEPERQRLIYQGHVLKDEKTLESYGIKPDHTVHLVKGLAAKKPSPSSSPSPANPAAAAAAAAGGGGNAGAGAGGAGTAPTPAGGGFDFFAGATGSPLDHIRNMANQFGAQRSGGGLSNEAMQQMQESLLRDPQRLEEMMNSPAMEQIMSDPEVMRTIMRANPQLSEWMDRNPELSHVLNDPETLRQSMAMARNPNLMREQMRTADRAMSNIESLPEGFNHLRRMYENFQEPLSNMSSISGGGSANPANTGANNDATGDNRESGQGGDVSGSQGGGNVAGANPFEALRSGGNSAAPPNTSPLPNPWAAGGDRQQAGANRSAQQGLGGLESLLGQLGSGFGGLGGPRAGTGTGTGNNNNNNGNGGNNDGGGDFGGALGMEAIQSMLEDPQMQSMMNSMLSQPGALEAMMSANPETRAMIDANPQMREMLRNPEFLSRLTNPANLQAMMNMQRSMQQLQQGGMTQLLEQLQGSGMRTLDIPTSGITVQVAPETRFESQLEQLRAMGFHDQQENIRILTEVGGNVNAAVERLLNQPN
eukprot:CAMPEP_0198239698 /NCGR_PEP_ID=MMETSP1446-20131203/5041_1 /TAXON_ID=1461542 ORGANISM="Unidentified sp, Strain CCMP2111" /NCGR_SAMPLE_ID=MMETSP1446 /ASSEMBLY_ACC=CAM_ASM_001112 /LENGTH=572 /DNA_ID=CAMNT_0043922333 /DNA_START=274 /DNA_END=1992 /DNA_ORIENTATION=+